MANWSKHVSLSRSGSVSGAQYGSSFSFPDFLYQALCTLQFEVSNVSGGDAPSFAVDLELSNDGNNWETLTSLEGGTTLTLSGPGGKFLKLNDDPIVTGLGAYRYGRLKVTPGGTSVAASWDAGLHLQASYREEG